MKAPKLLRKLRGALVAGALVLTAAGTANAETYYVDDENCSDTAYNGLSATISGTSGPFCTIQRALDLAQDGDVVSIEGGTYDVATAFNGVVDAAVSFVARNDAANGETTVVLVDGLQIDLAGTVSVSTGAFQLGNGANDTVLDLEEGTLAVDGGSVSIASNGIVERTAGNVTGALAYAGAANVVYNGATSVEAGTELPADLKGGSLTVAFTAAAALTIDQVDAAAVAVNENSTIAGTLLFDANGSITGPAAGTGTIGSVNVITGAGGTNPVVTVANDVAFTGTLLLSGGGFSVNAGGDLSPALDAGATVTVNAANPNTVITGGGSFNADGNEYNLGYFTPSNSTTGIAGTRTVGSEFQTGNIIDLTVDADNGTIDASAAPAGAISGNVQILGGDLSSTTGAGATEEIVVILPNAGTQIEGTLLVEENAEAQTAGVLELNSNATVAGEISGAGSILLDADNITVTGSTATTAVASIIDVTVDPQSNATIVDVNNVNGDVNVGAGATLSVSLIADDAANGDWGDITGNVMLATDAAGLTLASNVAVAGNVTVNEGTVAFGDNSLFVTGDFAGLADAAYTAGTGALVFPTASNFGTAGDAVPNVTIQDDVTLTSGVAISGAFVQDGSDDEIISSAGNDLTLSGTASLAGATFFSGAGTLTANGATATLAADADVSNLTVDGGLTLVSAGTGAPFDLTIASDLTMESGDLAQGTTDVLVQDLDVDGGSFSSEGGNLVVQGGDIMLAANVSIPRLVLPAAAAVSGTDFDVAVTEYLALENGAFDADAAGGVLSIADGATIERHSTGSLAVITDNLTLGAGLNYIYGDADATTTETITTGTELAPVVNNITVNRDPLVVDSDVTVNGTLRIDGVSITENADDDVTLADGATLELAGATAAIASALSFAGNYTLSYDGYNGTVSTNEFVGGQVATLRLVSGTLIVPNLANTEERVGNVEIQGGTLEINADFTATGDVTIAAGASLTDDGSDADLIFGGSAPQTFSVGGDRSPDYDVVLAMAGSAESVEGNPVDARVLLEGGDLNFVTNGQMLVLNQGVLVTGENTVVLQHGGVGGTQGFTVDGGYDSFVAGNVQKAIMNQPGIGGGVLAGRVTFPVGTENGEYRPLDVVFPTEILTGQTFNTTLTVSHDASSPEGIEGLPIAGDDATVTGRARFSWEISADPRLNPTTQYAIEATAEGFETNNVDALRLIRRADGEVENNPWRLVGTSYDNFAIELGEEEIPTVVATGAMFAIDPQGAILTYGLTSSLAILNTIANQELTVGGDPFTVNLNNIFAGGEGTIEFEATSSAPSVVSTTVDNGTLTVTAQEKGVATITVRALDVVDGDVQSVNQVSFVVTVPTGVATEAEAALPTEFALHGNYPNPFNPTTSISFDLPEAAEVTLEVVDMLGRHVMNVPAQQFQAGAKRSIQLNAASLSSGAYVYRLVVKGATATHTQTGRMMLVK